MPTGEVAAKKHCVRLGHEWILIGAFLRKPQLLWYICTYVTR